MTAIADRAPSAGAKSGESSESMAKSSRMVDREVFFKIFVTCTIAPATWATEANDRNIYTVLLI